MTESEMTEASGRYAELLEAATQGTLSRRAILRRAVALGLSAPAITALLAACGGAEETPSGSGSDTPATATSPSEATPSGEDDASPTTEAESERGGHGELNILYWQAATILNPHLSQGTKDWHPARICMEPLAEFSTDGKMLLVLADEEPTLENGLVAEDGLSVTWKLKQGVTWHDGEPFTSKDVKFTWEYLSDPATGATTYGTYETIASIDTPDDYTVVIHFKAPEPGWHKPFTGEHGMILPEHLLREHIGENARNAEFNLKPIGTGPYKVVDFVPGDVVVYELNENYREPGKPHFDRVVLKGGGDAASAARAVLQTGEADWAWNLQVEPQVLDAMAQGGTGELVIWPGLGTEVLLLNHADPGTELDGQRAHKDVPHPHFKELKVRQAVAACIPRDVIATTLYGAGGEATAATLTSPTNLIPSDISWEFDLEKAKQLLEEAGATPGADGILELNGRPMKWLYQTTVNPVRQKIQEIIKASFTELGIDCELKTIESSVFFSADPGNEDTVSRFYADLEMYNTGAKNTFPIDWYRRYLSTAIAQKENNWANYNYSRYQNPEFDELFDQLATELDPEKSTELLLEMQRLVWRDVAEIGIVAVKRVAAASSTLAGYEPTSWRPDVADIANWRRV